MDPTVLVTISNGIQIIGALTPVAIDVALRIKKLLSGADSGEAFTVQITAFHNGILQDADATDAIINDWMAKHPEV